MAGDLITIGAEEYVTIGTWGITIPARIDTGATTTSLDARNIKIKGNTVTFNMPEQYGGTKISLPIVAWKYIRTSRSRNRRPVVEMELCILSKKIHARVNLNDRSCMQYPMIIGRNVLTGNFIVDTARPHSPSSGCFEEKDK